MDFKDRLKDAQSAGERQGEDIRRSEQEQADALARSTDRCSIVVQQIADDIRRSIESFIAETPEFRSVFGSTTVLSIQYDRPVIKDRRVEKLLSYLKFEIKSYPEYSDVEVSCHRCVGNRNERHFTAEEDVFTGDPSKLKSFAEEQILRFARDYAAFKQMYA